MFDLQYNGNSHLSHLNKRWKHARRRDSREELEKYINDYEKQFLRQFNKPTGLEWRIVKVKI